VFPSGLHRCGIVKIKYVPRKRRDIWRTRWTLDIDLKPSIWWRVRVMLPFDVGGSGRRGW
jgi:hypothetical protein